MISILLIGGIVNSLTPLALDILKVREATHWTLESQLLQNKCSDLSVMNDVSELLAITSVSYSSKSITLDIRSFHSL